MAVVRDLYKSPYVSYYKGLTFYFSSALYKNKFDAKIEAYVTEEKLKIATKYKVSVEMCDIDDLLAISLYRQIEKRGTRIIDYDGQEFTLKINKGGL